MQRGSGILMHISSLPSPYGIGTLGKAAHSFLEFLSVSGQGCWQMLPIGPTGAGDSPYQPFCSFAGNPYFIDLDRLCEGGLLLRRELEDLDGVSDPRFVDYGRIYKNRFKVLYAAFNRGFGVLEDEVGTFRSRNPWVEEYSLFMALKNKFSMKPWQQWPCDKARNRDEYALSEYRDELRSLMDFYVFQQYLFYEQWKDFKMRAEALGISIIGDVPIYVSADSVDVWANPELFKLDGRGDPAFKAGVPPDYFSGDGQLWGNPVYDWRRHSETGYSWWIERLKGAHKFFDVIRLDHFRGFEAYWEVPGMSTTARFGRWSLGPGKDFVDALRAGLPSVRIIAEDLGYMTAEVRELVRYSGYPNTEVVQFAFSPQGSPESGLHGFSENSVCYTGTHDNNTAIGWALETSREVLDTAKRYLGFRHIYEAPSALIRGCMGSASTLAIVPIQDWLGLGASCRMNIPGTVQGNWRFRVKDHELNYMLSERIGSVTEVFGRLSLSYLRKRF